VLCCAVLCCAGAFWVLRDGYGTCGWRSGGCRASAAADGLDSMDGTMQTPISSRLPKPTPCSTQPRAHAQVSSSSGAQAVSTALVQRIREGAVPCLTGIGVDAVSNCVLAIGHSRLALEAEGLDIRARPEFISIQKNDTTMNALKFHIHVDRI